MISHFTILLLHFFVDLTGSTTHHVNEELEECGWQLPSVSRNNLHHEHAHDFHPSSNLMAGDRQCNTTINNVYSILSLALALFSRKSKREECEIEQNLLSGR